MQLPASLRGAIEDYIGDTPLRDLQRAADELSRHYREHKRTQSAPIAPGLRAKAYLAIRFAATFAAVSRVLAYVTPPRSVLDLGAGPGTAALAAMHGLSGIESVSLVESDVALREAGRVLLPGAQWLTHDFTTAALPPHDLVIAAWSLGETASPVDAALQAWKAAQSTLVIVEPGTTQSFARIRAIRERLIAEGAGLAAPCPSHGPCPMDSKDWCHFSQRVERTALHRRLKGGTLAYEDEKFCYLVFTRTAPQAVANRIVRHPQIQPNLISLQVCTGERIEERKITHRNKDAWRAARKAVWGDAWT